MQIHQHKKKQIDSSVHTGPRPRRRSYNGSYQGEHLNRVAFPMGGIGAGMICLEGTGALSHVSIRNRPEVFTEPCVFSAIHIKESGITRVLEGPVPKWKLFGRPHTGGGAPGTTYGLPRFRSASFLPRFPFATVSLFDEAIPLDVTITGWSPFTPGNADDSSLPVAALEFRFANRGDTSVSAVYSFNARNFLATNSGGASVEPLGAGFVLRQPGNAEKPWEETALCAQVDDDQATTDCAWFRGGWWDPLTMIWEKVSTGDTTPRPPHQEGDSSPGGSVFVPFSLGPGEEKTVRLRLSWYTPNTNLRTGKPPSETEGCCSNEPVGCCGPSQPTTYKPWYAGSLCVDSRGRFLLGRPLRLLTGAEQGIQRLLLRHHTPGRGRRSGRRQPDDPQVTDRPPANRRPTLGLGGQLRRARLLRGQLYPRVELCSGDLPSLSRA